VIATIVVGSDRRETSFQHIPTRLKESTSFHPKNQPIHLPEHSPIQERTTTCLHHGKNEWTLESPLSDAEATGETYHDQLTCNGLEGKLILQSCLQLILILQS